MNSYIFQCIGVTAVQSPEKTPSTLSFVPLEFIGNVSGPSVNSQISIALMCKR